MYQAADVRDAPSGSLWASHRLLLDEDVYEAAMTAMPRLFPGDMTQQVRKRMTKPKMGDQQSEWLRRILAVAEADGMLQGLAG